jgi:stage III sporulation protein AF
MNSWILGIVGIVFLGVMIEIIMPNGKINLFIKSIFVLVFMYVLMNPILKLVKATGLDVSKIFITEGDDYLQHLKQEGKLKIENYLFKNGVIGVVVEVDGYSTSNDFIVNKIQVNISNLVINENVTHINKYKLITGLIMEVINVSEENIVYG